MSLSSPLWGSSFWLNEMPRTTPENLPAFTEPKKEAITLVMGEISPYLRLAHSTTSKDDFIKAHIAPAKQTITEMDQRTNAFFQEMRAIILLQATACEGMAESITILQATFKDGCIGEKIIESAALPHILQMKERLEGTSPSIVDAIQQLWTK